MGESQALLFEPTFNRFVKVQVKDERITSDGGVLLLREADHRLGLVESIAAKLYDPRRQRDVRYTLTELLRERLYAMAQGYSAQDDADRLAHDPAFKMSVWDRRGDDVLNERLGSQPTQSRLVNLLPGRSIARLCATRWRSGPTGICEAAATIAPRGTPRSTSTAFP